MAEYIRRRKQDLRDSLLRPIRGNDGVDDGILLLKMEVVKE
jgi:hypothetical protein